MQKGRYRSIALLKCMAALLITNSHLNVLYPENISFLAFGGFWGNSLFFLISGYLLVGCDKSFFPKWYARRVLRIYIPYLVVLPLLLFEEYTRTAELGGAFIWLFPINKFHFIPTILVLYPIYYLMTWLNNRKYVNYWFSLLFVVSFQLLYYFFFFDFSYEIDGDFKLIPMLSYFEIMLIGGLIRQYKEKISRYRAMFVVLMLVSSMLYVYQVFTPFTDYFEIIQLYAGVVFSSALACIVISMESKIPTWGIIDLIGDLTLEIYLVQFMLIDAFVYFAFPLDVFICLVSIVGTAYCINYISEIIRKGISITK